LIYRHPSILGQLLIESKKSCPRSK
jgi:hypothetical protein